MKPTQAFWENIPGHTSAGYRTPPASWTSCLFGLIGDQKVQHSYNAVTPPTTVTSGEACS
ncbi:hypothetical protein [Rhodococcus globerulus]|uniref:hypothetical protein n=1 Tax=Rhodococcus globerulus TaxID=33008 RepID=UPI00140319DD|nr:hypothetical protein [Rhodococcus globerulus]